MFHAKWQRKTICLCVTMCDKSAVRNELSMHPGYEICARGKKKCGNSEAKYTMCFWQPMSQLKYVHLYSNVIADLAENSTSTARL